MDEESNMSIRKFLKQVGVTSQQAIEDAMRERDDTAGKIYDAKVVLTIEGLDVHHEVTGKIKGEE